MDASTPDRALPRRLHRCGGRKRIVAPDGSAIVPNSRPQPNGTLVKAACPTQQAAHVYLL
jgi:hypothetical protein